MPSEIIPLVPPILATVKIAYDVFQAWMQHSSKTKRKDAIRKLYLALGATSDYFEITKDLKAKRDLEFEERLDRLWRDTAKAVEAIDPNLAERLYVKADYWRNPDAYGVKSKANRKRLDEANITIKDLRAEIAKLL